MSKFFSIIDPITYEGPETDNPLAFRHYSPSKKVLGMAEPDKSLTEAYSDG
jgi:xylose isomerase